MLTLIDSISLAGDRAKQNDDAAGAADGCAWVIDGATDLHDAPMAGAATDAAWFAHHVNALLFAEPLDADEARARARIRAISAAAREAFLARAGAEPAELWKSPLASMVAAAETREGVAGYDLGDCRFFALDANGAAHACGGPPDAADNETRLASSLSDSVNAAALLRDQGVLGILREKRGLQIAAGGAGTLCLNPACADQARAWRFALARPAHILLASDGFAALVDRYRAMSAGAFVTAAHDQGLHELARQLRAIEHDDAAGALHPRWKKSDDATALLLRLT